MGREEHRAQLERRRAGVAHQLRRLAIELADLDSHFVLPQIWSSGSSWCEWKGQASYYDLVAFWAFCPPSQA